MKTKFYIGLDVHKEKTAYAVRDWMGNILLEGESTTLYSDLHMKLQPYLNFSQIGLESSTSYYALYGQFLKNNYNVKVANTTQMRQLIAKNDKLDAMRLAEMLRLGSFPASYIPDEAIQHIRSLVHTRHSMMEEKTRCNTRIQALLDRNGIVMPPQKAFGKRWKNALMQYFGTGEVSPEIRHAYDHYVFLEKKEEQLNQEMIGHVRKHWDKEYSLLQGITGIGSLLACYIIAEVCPIQRFASKRKLRRYAGVVPTFQESADKTSRGKIPKSSSRKLLRWALIQAANAIAKTNTKLGCYYRKKKKQKKNTGIAKVAVASSLVDIIYEVLTKGKPYIAA